MELKNFQLVRGQNPNLAAGQRAIAVRPESPYVFTLVPHNAQFYNFGDSPFTVFLCYLDLGAARAYDQTGLLTKYSSGTGWGLTKQNAAGNITFEMKSGGGIGLSIADRRAALMDGLFHTITITKAGPAAGQEPNDVELVRMFRDGVEVTGSNISKRGTTGREYDADNPVAVGGFNGYFLRGYIDVAAFYNVGLTDLEIFNLNDVATRTDRGAKFILDFNQLSAPELAANRYKVYDSTSIGQNGEAYLSAIDAQGRGFVRIDGIRTFARNTVLSTPLNGHFTPVQPSRVIGISRFDQDVTEAQYSLDNVSWIPISFDATGMSNNLPAYIQLDAANPTLYLRASNANVSYLNALELHY